MPTPVFLWSSNVLNAEKKPFIFFLQLFDGHNGSGAATYAKENLLDNVLSAIPSDLTREEWLAALPRALVAGFVKTDKEFQTKGMFGLLNCNFAPLVLNDHY